VIDDHVRHDVEDRDVQDAVPREELGILGQQRHGIPPGEARLPGTASRRLRVDAPVRFHIGARRRLDRGADILGRVTDPIESADIGSAIAPVPVVDGVDDGVLGDGLGRGRGTTP